MATNSNGNLQQAMDNFGINYVGLTIRYLYIKYFLKRTVNYKELYKKTKYGKNLGYIKTSNHNLGVITSIFLAILILLIYKVAQYINI